MFFILRNESVLQTALKAISSLNLGKVFSVEIKEYRKNRTASQNRLLWGCWYKLISDYTGYTPEELHEYYKLTLLGTQQLTVMGRTIAVPKSSTGLNTKEFAAFLDGIETHAADLGINLPHNDDYRELVK